MELEAGRSTSLRERLAGRWAFLVSARWSLALALVLGAAPGQFLFPLVFDKRSALLDNLELTARDRLLSVVFVGVSLLLFFLGLLGFRRLRVRRGREETFQETLAAWNRATFWLLGLPPIAALAIPKVETAKPWLAIFSAGMLAVVAVAFLYRLPSVSLPRIRGASLVVGLLVVAYAALFSFFAIRQHHALGTHTFDLGIYDNLFWNTLQGRWLASTFVRSGTHLSAHFDPIIVLLSPIYALNPRAETLLVLQSVWLALGAIPLFILAKRKLESPWLGVALVLVYLLYPALHGVNLYDFHTLALAGPVLIAVVAALEVGALRVYWFFFALALSVREDIPLILVGVGLYALLVHRRTKTGFATIGLAIAYFAFVKFFVMLDPGIFMDSSRGTYGYAYYYKDLMGKGGGSVFDMLASIVGNPVFVLKHLTTEPKLRFFFLLFLPLLFVPLCGRRRLVVLLYGFAFLFLSSRKPVHTIHFQYTTVLTPLAFAILPPVLAELRESEWVRAIFSNPRRLATSLVCGMLVSTTALSLKFGAIGYNESFKAGFSNFVRKTRSHHVETHRWLTDVLSRVPKEASVSATSRLGPHVSNRDEVYGFPRKTDFVFVHRGDLGGKGRARLDELRKDGYVVFDRHRDVTVYRKGDGGGGAEGEAKSP